MRYFSYSRIWLRGIVESLWFDKQYWGKPFLTLLRTRGDYWLAIFSDKSEFMVGAISHFNYEEGVSLG